MTIDSPPAPWLVSTLKSTGLLPLLWSMRRRMFRREDSRESQQLDAFLNFQRLYGHSLGYRFVPEAEKSPAALIVGVGQFGIEVELGLIKAIEMAGYRPIILTGLNEWSVRYYRLAGLRDLFFWDEFLGSGLLKDAQALIQAVHSLPELLNLRYHEINVGKYTASTALRYVRTGSLDFESTAARGKLTEFLAASLRSARSAYKILKKTLPALALFVDRGYTPFAELFDLCISTGVDTVTWNAAHRNNTLMLKRYNGATADEHPSSVGADVWQCLLESKWGENQRTAVRSEIQNSYASGEWYGEVGTQVNKKILVPSEARERLGLNPARKTAIVFPHIFWDATFFWGTDLFANYEEWFIRVVQHACSNDRVNWVIKIHPANIVKNARDGYSGEPSEMAAIRQHVGTLPRHVSIIPAESDINTYSLFGIMDYCLTVRGTIGIEAASFGIPVFTAGTGRYDRHGFTIDSNTREEYLARLAQIDNYGPLMSAECERAEKYAYAVFLLRPLPLKTVTLEYQKDATASLFTRINARRREDWLEAPDMTSLSRWINSRAADFICPDLLS